MFKDLPSQQMNSIISRVTYPVLSQMRDNPVHLKGGYKRMITSTTFISFILLAGLAAVAEPLVITLIGEPWRPAIIYLQMLCFVGMMYPLQALNLSMLNVQGRSDLFLKLEIIKKLLAVPVIVIGVLWGMKVMIAGMMVNTTISYYLNSYWSGKMVNYPMREQVKDITPSFLLAIFMATIVYLAGLFLPVGYLAKLLVQLLLGAIIVFTTCELLHFSPYLYLKEIVVSKITSFRNARK
jgi:O-antigen/teichoic acid export membrane protein